MVTAIKKAIKKTIGAKNALKVAQIRRNVRTSTFRLLRLIFKGKTSLPALPMKIFSLTDMHLFFGYYDVPQFNRDENLLLAMAAPLIKKTPSPNHRLRLGFFDLSEANPQFQEFSSTNTWCWQQGCRLQWYPFKSESTVLYNTLVEERYGCVILDVNRTIIKRTFLRPIYSVSRDGKWGLSLDFARLQRLRPGYGYNVIPDSSTREAIPDCDGIWRIDMETGTEKLLFSVRDIAELHADKVDAGVHHYFNHLIFNPSGDRFMFFHIRQLFGGKRFIRMLTSDLDGENIRLIDDSGLASHYTWKDNDHLLCYTTVAGNGEGYYIFNVYSGEIQPVGARILTADGHPSYLPGGKHLITDTYPDRFGESSLLLYDCMGGKLTVLAKEYSTPSFNSEIRCDMHPRVGPSGKTICYDGVSHGKRVMNLLDISSMFE